MKMNEMTGNGMAIGEVRWLRRVAVFDQSVQMEGRVQEAHDAYVIYFEQNEIDYSIKHVWDLLYESWPI